MKISMFGQIKFYVEVDLLTVVDLRRLALVHYDGVCKSTAAQGGILNRWEEELIRRPEDVVASNKAWWPQATWRDLDTLAKVCEHSSLFFDLHNDAAAKARIAIFAKQVGHVLRTSHDHSKDWNHDFEELI